MNWHKFAEEVGVPYGTVYYQLRQGYCQWPRKFNTQKRHAHPLYYTWINMKQRCNNPNNTSYEYYGARGIQVCGRWYEFWNFVQDMGERPEGCSLDRIDRDGNYEPNNVRWATAEQQNRNKDNFNHYVNVSYDTSGNRIKRWKVDVGPRHNKTTGKRFLTREEAESWAQQNRPTD